jgi:hypothetical protein
LRLSKRSIKSSALLKRRISLRAPKNRKHSRDSTESAALIIDLIKKLKLKPICTPCLFIERGEFAVGEDGLAGRESGRDTFPVHPRGSFFRFIGLLYRSSSSKSIFME